MVREYNGDRERVNFYLDKDLLAGMKKLAKLMNTTYSELIRRSCSDYLAARTPKATIDNQNLKEFVK